MERKIEKVSGSAEIRELVKEIKTTEVSIELLDKEIEQLHQEVEEASKKAIRSSKNATRFGTLQSQYFTTMERREFYQRHVRDSRKRLPKHYEIYLKG